MYPVLAVSSHPEMAPRACLITRVGAGTCEPQHRQLSTSRLTGSTLPL